MKVLIVDDEEAMREVLEVRISGWGYDVVVAGDGEEARRRAREFGPDLVISDVVLPDLSGLDLLRTLRNGDAERPVILITAHGTVELAVEAIKQGARDFLTKPLDYSKMQSVLRAAEDDLKARERSQKISKALGSDATGFGLFVGRSKPMRELYSLIADIGSTDAAVLITGESGTGKELAARTIHTLSSRKSGPFVAVNTAAVPQELMESEIFGHEKGAFTGALDLRRGCFEVADTGSLFLDEIAEMPIQLQPKLLRVLEDGRVRRLGGTREHQFDVRLVAATNQDPRKAVEEGSLRTDLYYRLNVFTLTLPPLRKRTGDLELLCQHFISLFSEKHGTDVQGVSGDALRCLEAYRWPGNVRELRNVMERAVVLAKKGWVDEAQLPPYIRNPDFAGGARIVLPVGTTLADAEKELILKTLEQAGNNKAEAARRLGLDVKTIRNKLKSYGSK